MKNYLKFVVVVFGVTLAILCSIQAKAKPVAAIRCSGDVGGCAKVEGAGWLVGKRSDV